MKIQIQYKLKPSLKIDNKITPIIGQFSFGGMMSGRLAGWQYGRLAVWQAGWQVAGWLAGGRVAGWLAGGRVAGRWQGGWQVAGWQAGRLAELSLMLRNLVFFVNNSYDIRNG